MVVYLLGVSEKHQPNSRHSVRQRPLCLRLPSHTSWRRELFSFFLFYLQQITLQSLKKKSPQQARRKKFKCYKMDSSVIILRP